MSAVRAEDGIVVAQVRADAGGDRLFAHVGMAGAVDQPHLMRAGQLLFGVANNEHLPVERMELLRLGHSINLLCNELESHP